MLTIIVAVALLFVMLIAMAVKVLFVKNGRFPDSHACRLNDAKRTTRVRSADENFDNGIKLKNQE